MLLKMLRRMFLKIFRKSILALVDERIERTNRRLEQRLTGQEIKIPLPSPQTVEVTAQQAWDELDLNYLYEKVAEKVTAILLGNKGEKTDLLERVADEVGNDVWDNLNMEELYPYIGEKVVALLREKNKKEE